MVRGWSAVAGHAATQLHGENDIALAPAEARRLLVDRFGVDALERFVELPREGHSFRRVESWARVYAALLALWNGTS